MCWLAIAAGALNVQTSHDASLATGFGRRVVTLRDGGLVDDVQIEPRRIADPGELVQLRAIRRQLDRFAATADDYARTKASRQDLTHQDKFMT